jgi:glycosyltransferase involved in cell wall biosynthesis
MRVAIFTDNDFEKVNGVTTTLKAVLRHAPPGIRPRVYTASRLEVDEPEYLSLKSPGAPIPFYPEMRLYLPRVGEYLRRARADRIEVIHLTTPGPMGLAAMRVARQLGVPMVGSFHTDLAAYAAILSGSGHLRSVMREYMKWPYGRCARVLVPSEATRQLLMDGKGDPRRMDLWRRGVNGEQFNPSQRSDELRRQWRVSRSRPAVIYVGRVSKEKGLDVLPHLHEMLEELGLAHRFIIVGDGPMLPELRSRLTNAVFTGTLAPAEVARAFASADVFLFPSRTDTAGNVVLEAQACGVPTLVSDAGGPRENIVDGETGHIVSGTDAAAWAGALSGLLRDERRRAAMASAARRYAESRTWEEALEPLYRAYRDLGAASRSSSILPEPDLVTRGASLS